PQAWSGSMITGCWWSASERHVQICTIDTATGRSSPVIAVNWPGMPAPPPGWAALLLLAGARQFLRGRAGPRPRRSRHGGRRGLLPETDGDRSAVQVSQVNPERSSKGQHGEVARLDDAPGLDLSERRHG